MKLQFILFASAIALSNASPYLIPQVLENQDTTKYDCTGTIAGDVQSSAQFICNDWRLGPKILPKYFPLSSELADYDRFGGLTPGDFLKQWWDSTGDGSYIFPGKTTNGFATDIKNNPISGVISLPAGTLLDRFGGETGSYLSSADTPYSQRSLPPSSLNYNKDYPGFPYNYHVYRVKKDLEVTGGLIAPGFEQAGLGTQFFTGQGVSIQSLIDDGSLEKVDLSLLATDREKNGWHF